MACFELEEYETALRAFESGKKLLSATNSELETNYNRAIRKCIAELEG